MTTSQTFMVTVTSRKPIADLLSHIENRLWTMDGVVDVLATERLPKTPAALPSHLASEAAAVGADRDAESLEQGEPV